MAGEDGALRPVKGIDRCPHDADGRPCRLSKQDWRERQTGPGFPVAILRCRTHGKYFTVYPTGFTPFGRQRTAPAPQAGEPGAACDERARWTGTLFEAAAQAAAGNIGVRDAGYDAPSKPRHSTQRRRVDRAARLLGLSAEIDEQSADTVAQALDLPGLDHRQARAEYGCAGTLRERGTAIMSALARIPVSPTLERRLLCAGVIVGLWGPPVLWDPRFSRLFRPCGTDPPKPLLERALAPHEIVSPRAPRTSPTVPRS